MAIPLPQVVLLGDSLFQGASNVDNSFSFQAACQEQCMRRLDVINRGFGGYNTSQVLKALPQIIAPPSPGGPKMEYLLVWLGANDAAIPLAVDNQHVPLDQYKKNLTSIINHPNIVAHNAQILLITPPPLDEIKIETIDRALGRPEATRKSKISASYAQVVREVASTHPKVILIDYTKALLDHAVSKTPGFSSSGPPLGDPECGQQGYLEQLLPDGLHLSGEAYEVLWGLVQPHITPGWANLGDVERNAMSALPEWRVAPWMD